MTESARAPKTKRIFKTKWFSKEARKEGINDDELCAAIQQVMKGQADDLGGGVLKKRLNKNMHRAIIVAKGAKYWVYVYLFAKKDRENIDDDELEQFRKLADGYAAIKDEQLEDAIKRQELVEICL
jgi:hypothetical protein